MVQLHTLNSDDDGLARRPDVLCSERTLFAIREDRKAQQRVNFTWVSEEEVELSSAQTSS